jgi:hypothetical protein
MRRCDISISVVQRDRKITQSTFSNCDGQAKAGTASPNR